VGLLNAIQIRHDDGNEHGAFVESAGVTLIDMFGCLLALRRHLRRIGRSGDAAPTELLALDVVFGEVRLDAVWLAFSGRLSPPLCDWPTAARMGGSSL
jgi:hypothetical protein